MGQLEQLGTKIYIDSMDNKMSQETSGMTAARIKKVIKFCNKFILLATGKAIQSYWCNWELGIGDTHKFIEHIAILPMKEKGATDRSWAGNECLQIYPSIQYEDGTSHQRYPPIFFNDFGSYTAFNVGLLQTDEPVGIG